MKIKLITLLVITAKFLAASGFSDHDQVRTSVSFLESELSPALSLIFSNKEVENRVEHQILNKYYELIAAGKEYIFLDTQEIQLLVSQDDECLLAIIAKSNRGIKYDRIFSI